MRTLLPGDAIGVMAFDTVPVWAAPLQPVGANGDAIAAKIMSISPGGGTIILPALRKAMESLDSLSAKNYPVRHIVLLSDGQTAGDDPRSIIPELNERKISLSTVIIGDQPNMELMRSLAEAGGAPGIASTIRVRFPGFS
jgi:uncharacterized protein with von Willebrand factor type A (vWA) domain